MRKNLVFLLEFTGHGVGFEMHEDHSDIMVKQVG